MSHPPITIVDENDQVIGQSEMFKAWDEGLRHRVARIMIEDKDGRLLLQKRSARMHNFPNCWDHSAAGHVDADEDYDTAAKRELEEEIGVKGVALEQVDTYYNEEKFYHKEKGRDFVLKRFSALYKGVVDEDTEIVVDPEEVSEVKWFTLNEVKRLINDHPEQVTKGLSYVMSHYYED